MSKKKISKSPKLFIFYDESGDTGTKFNKGSTKFFISSILIVPRNRIKDFDKLIANLRSKYKFYGEIKYSKVRGDLKEEFIKGISGIRGIAAFSLIVDKRKYPGKSLTQKVKNTKDGKHRFSNFMTMYVIKKAKQRLRSRLINTELILDRIARHKEEEFSFYIFQQLNRNSQIISRITHVDSVYLPLIQMTDLISGVVRGEVEIKKKRGKQHTELWQIIKKFTRIYNIEREINLKKLKVV
jgi:hypothetical protein